MLNLPRSTIFRYSIAVFAVAVALTLTASIDLLAERTPLFFAAVITATWYGGRSAGLVALALSSAAAAYFILPPKNSFDLEPGAAFQLGTFVAVTLPIAWMMAALRTRERALRISEARYRFLFENNPFPMWIFDTETLRFLAVNDAATRSYGYTSEEFLAMTIRDIRPADDVPALLRHLSGDVPRIEPLLPWRHLKKDGTIIDVETSSHGVIVEGRPARLVLANNVTERKATEDSIRMLNETLEKRVLERTAELAAANSELEAFSYSISHDLRAPLRHINGFSQALIEDYSDKLDETGINHLNELRAASQEMAQLIDDVLDLAHVTRTEMHREPFDLSELARSVFRGIQKRDPERVVKVTIEEGLAAYGDKRLIGVVLTNLLENAWKFTAKRTFPQIEFGLDRSNGDGGYYVRDNGAGFDMAYADKLYGAFQRLHGATEFEGTGIGLATVRRIVERHGGQVNAKGEVNKGAAFYFTLPTDPGDEYEGQGDLAGGGQST